MNPGMVLLASQILAATSAGGGVPEQVHGARVTALATAVILSSGTTRDDGDARALLRHRRTTGDRSITVEFE